MGMRIDDEIYVHGYLDEIRQDKVIVRNEGGYFGTIVDELVEAIPKEQIKTNDSLLTNNRQLRAENRQFRADITMMQLDYKARLKADMKAILTEIKSKIAEKSYYDTTIIGNYEDEVRVELVELDDVNDIIQEKINALRGTNE